MIAFAHPTRRNRLSRPRATVAADVPVENRSRLEAVEAVTGPRLSTGRVHLLLAAESLYYAGHLESAGAVLRPVVAILAQWIYMVKSGKTTTTKCDARDCLHALRAMGVLDRPTYRDAVQYVSTSDNCRKAVDDLFELAKLLNSVLADLDPDAQKPARSCREARSEYRGAK